MEINKGSEATMKEKRTVKDNVVPVRKKKRKPASGKLKILLALCIILLILMTGVIIGQCQIEDIIINGNITYTKDEVEAAVREN